jgi:hypothetical protein
MNGLIDTYFFRQYFRQPFSQRFSTKSSAKAQQNEFNLVRDRVYLLQEFSYNGDIGIVTLSSQRIGYAKIQV